jgi:putative tryptophan/tyrosine transport system substrate-binding protein
MKPWQNLTRRPQSSEEHGRPNEKDIFFVVGAALLTCQLAERLLKFYLINFIPEANPKKLEKLFSTPDSLRKATLGFVRVIVASAAAATAVHKVVPDLPMVFTSYAADPIKAGFAESYVRPGGNTTGNVMNAVGSEEALTQKRMGLFKELVPDLKRLGFIGTATSILAVAELNALRSVAGHFGFEIVHHAIQGLDDIESAVVSSNRDGVGALYVSGEPLLYNNMARVLPFVMASGKPTVGPYPEWGRAGLLMSYSADLLDDFRRAGIYAAKILGGEKPGDLPIEQASKFTLVVNTRTAKQLGISVPPTLLTLADEVIE